MITPLSCRAFTLQDKNSPDGGSFISGGKCSPLLSTSRSSSLSSTWWTLSVRFSVTKYWRPSQILESSTCSQLYENDGDGGEFDVFPIVTPFPFLLKSRNYDWHGWWQRWKVIFTELTLDCHVWSFETERSFYDVWFYLGDTLRSRYDLRDSNGTKYKC